MIEQAASCVAQPEKLLAQRVVLSYALGQPVEAVEFARVLAHKFPRSSDVLLMFSQILIALGYFDDAQQVHQQILSIPHDYKSLLLERAHWHAAQYRFSQAEEVLRSLASARPADLDVSRRWLVMKLLDGDVIGAVELDRFIDDQLELDNKSQQRLNWRHDFERTLLKECFTNRYAFEALRNSRRLPTDLQLPKLVRGLSDEPGYLGFAIAALNSLRRSGAMTRVASGSEVQIPRRVTQYWDRQVPPKEVQAMMDSWKAQNPTWTYKRFNDVNAWDYLKDNASPAVLRAFESAAHPALRADLLRLAVLAFEGGVWGDADDRCVVPLDLLPHHGAELWLVQESFGTLGNNFIASRAGHPFVAYALEKVSRNILERQGRTVWFVSGPGAISLAFCNFYSERLKLSKLPHGVRIFDTYTFSRFVAQHLPLVYKHEGQHWNDRVERTKSLFRKPSGRPLAGAVKGSLKLMKDGRFQERQSVAKPTA
jgi:mannosyltransferase OCH1-like enzyme